MIEAAFHEAGHAVIAHMLDVAVQRVTLKRAITAPRRITARTPWKRALVSLAGPAAEDRFVGYPPAEHPALWRSAWAKDARNAASHLGAIDGDVAAAHREAVRLVREHWDAIARVAVALSEHGELSGDEVDVLIARPSRPPLRHRAFRYSGCSTDFLRHGLPFNSAPQLP